MYCQRPSSNIPASYSEDPGFRSWPEDLLSRLRFSWFSSVPPGEFQDGAFQLGHDRFPPNPFQFIIHLWALIRRYKLLVLVSEKASLSKLQTKIYSSLYIHSVHGCNVTLPNHYFFSEAEIIVRKRSYCMLHHRKILFGSFRFVSVRSGERWPYLLYVLRLISTIINHVFVETF
jgi:hypothetical protein